MRRSNSLKSCAQAKLAANRKTIIPTSILIPLIAQLLSLKLSFKKDNAQTIQIIF